MMDCRSHAESREMTVMPWRWAILGLCLVNVVERAKLLKYADIYVSQAVLRC